jgi:Flp pilus assembly protein TadD
MRTLLVGVCAGVALLAAGAGAADAQSLPPASIARQALAHYFEGQALLSAERWERASREFTSAIKLHPLLTDAYYGLGQAHMGLRQFTSAALAFQRCLEAARAVHGLRESARVRADQLTLDIAEEMRDTIRRRGPNSLRGRQLDAYVTRLLATRSSLTGPFEPPPYVLLALGSAHFRAGDSGRAEYYWQEAARRDATLGEAWNNLAVLHLRAGRKSDAERAVSHAERAGFDVPAGLKRDIARLP